MSYQQSTNSNIKSVQSHTLKAVAVGVLLSLSSGAYADLPSSITSHCNYAGTADNFDDDSLTNLVDGVPCDADLGLASINHLINGDFESGAQFWKVAGTTYTSVEGITADSNAISVTSTLAKKTLTAPVMQVSEISSVTINFWVKAETVADAALLPKLKLILDAAPGSTKKNGSNQPDKFLTAIQISNQDIPAPIDPAADDTLGFNAAEWLPVSVTFDFAEVNIASQEAIDDQGYGALINLVDGKYTGKITFKVQTFAADDTVLIDNMSIYSDTDKVLMMSNAVTDSDGDGIMNDVDPRPSQAYYTESKPSDDFDGDGVINSEDALPYEPNFSSDINNDGYADEQSAPLVNALSDTSFELLDAENKLEDNGLWNNAQFTSVIDALVGETSFKVDNSKESKSKTINIVANDQVTVGFWAKTDDASFNADGEALTVQVTLTGANQDTTDVVFTQVLNKADLTSDWQYFQIDQMLDESQSATSININFINPITANLGNIWIDGVVAFTDPNTEVLANFTTTDTDSDGIIDFMDNDDDNDGLLDGEDPQPLVAVGSYDLPDIDQDGNEDTLDADADGKLDYFNIDLTAPIITLVGDSAITVTEGETYTDQGATAADEVDGDVSSSIVVVNLVDTSIVGDHMVTYNVMDVAGNAAIEVSRVVTVMSNDITAPVFSGSLPDLTFDKASPSASITLADLTSAPVAIDAKDGEITAVTNFEDAVYQPGQTYVITWLATDAAGNTSETTQNLIVTAPEVIIEEVESKGGSFSFAGLFLMIGLFTRRLLAKK